MLKADAVFEGGGVKGIGLVGAASCLEDKGYSWQRCAGTSAGAIIAAMLAAGYSAKEMERFVREMDYGMFLDKSSMKLLSAVSKTYGFLFQKGIYSGDSFEAWMRHVLEAKGKTKFKNVSVNGQSRLKIMVTDITKKDMMVLPDDLMKYGIDPMEFDIARAVRMSVGIPFYFKPVVLKGKDESSYIVDGGVVSNFPIWIFDVERNPRWPTFGFKFTESKPSRTSMGRKDLISYALDIIDTMLDKNEARYVKNKDIVRTVLVPNLGVKTTEFNITREKCSELFDAGYEAAGEFIQKWNFQQYVRKYRNEQGALKRRQG